jgi:hypothetical protein
VLSLEGLLDVYATSRAEIIANADGPGWNTRVKLMVATTIFSPLGWLLFILGAGFILRTKRGVFWLWALVIFISLIPFLMALRNLLSVKYMMPIFALLPIWAAMLWMAFAARLPEKARRGVQALWITASVLLCLIAVEPDNAPPYILVTAQDARQIGTHDGRRTWGAYAWQLADVARQNPTPKDAGAAQVFVAKATSGLAQDVWLVGPPNVFGHGGLGWRHIYLALEKAGWQGAPIGDGRIRFDVPGADIILSLDTEGAPDTACVLALQDVRDPATALTNTCQN